MGGFGGGGGALLEAVEFRAGDLGQRGEGGEADGAFAIAQGDGAAGPVQADLDAGGWIEAGAPAVL